MKIRVWYAIIDLGDGGSTVRLFPSKGKLDEYCDKHNSTPYREIFLGEDYENVGYEDFDPNDCEKI